MTTHSPSIERATELDLEHVERLLAANDLPTADVRDSAPAFFIGRVDGDVVGVGGLETHGNVGLLRSVVVPEQHRGRGYGAAICAALESRAGEDGVSTLYLLTTTATEFFRARGYELVDRDGVPGAVRETSQFTDLCPASATCMRKRLE